MSRASNADLIADLRNELTHGFDCGDLDRDDVLQATKEWRGRLWAKLAEVEARLCPLVALERNKNGER